MSQPKWSAAWLPAWEASHLAFINQLLNAPISASPPSSLPRKSTSLSSNCEEISCSGIELQDLFNMLDLIERARVHNYTASWLMWKQASPEVEQDFGEPAVNVLLRFISQETLVAFDVHAFLSYDLRILSRDRKMLDPKTIFLLKRTHFYCEKILAPAP